MSSADKTETLPHHQLAARGARPERVAAPVAPPVAGQALSASPTSTFKHGHTVTPFAPPRTGPARLGPVFVPPRSEQGPDRVRPGPLAPQVGERVVPLTGPPPTLGMAHSPEALALATGSTQIGRKLGSGVASSAYSVAASTGKSTGFVLLVTKQASVDCLVKAERHHRAIAAAAPGVVPAHGGIAYTEQTRRHGQLMQAVDHTMDALVAGKRDATTGMPVLGSRTITGQDVAALGALIGSAFQRLADAKVGYVDHKPGNLGFTLASGDARPAQVFRSSRGGVYNSPWHQVLVLDVGAAKTPEYLAGQGESDRSLTPNSVPKSQAAALLSGNDDRLRKVQASPGTYAQAMAEHLYGVITGEGSQDREVNRRRAEDPSLDRDPNRLKYTVVAVRAEGSSYDAIRALEDREQSNVLPKGFAAAFKDAFAGSSTPEQFARALTDAAGLTKPERPPGIMGWLRRF